jgi:hypothetical protein
MEEENVPFPERPDGDENNDGEYSVATALVQAIVKQNEIINAQSSNIQS